MIIMIMYSLMLIPLLYNAIVQAQNADEDLMSFVTLPHVRALQYNVHYDNRDRVSPGYWFVSPYGRMKPEEPTQQYQQYQIGPYIYDGDGVIRFIYNINVREMEEEMANSGRCLSGLDPPCSTTAMSSISKQCTAWAKSLIYL